MPALCPRCSRVAWLRHYCARCDLVLLPRDAETVLQQLSALPGDASAELDIAIDTALLRLLLDRPESARDTLRSIVEDSPTAARARLALALAEDGAGELAAALRHTTAALRMSPLCYLPPRTPAERLAASVMLGRRRQLEAMHVQPITAMELGRIRMMCGDGAAALDAYTLALRSRPNDPQLLTAIGVALRMLGKPEEAIDLHRRALEEQPDYSLAHNNLSAAYADLGRIDEAIGEANAAVAIDPSLGHAWASVAAAQLEAGHADGAIEAAIEAETRAPELTPIAAALRGAAHIARAETDKAREQAWRGLQHALAHRAPQLGFVLGQALDRREQTTAAREARRPLWFLMGLDSEP